MVAEGEQYACCSANAHAAHYGQLCMGFGWLVPCSECFAFARVQEQFAGLFEPKRWHDAYWWGSNFTPAEQNARVIALCLAAAMAETGDL